MELYTYTISHVLHASRLDKALAIVSGFSRARCRKLIESGHVKVAGEIQTAPKFRVREYEVVHMYAADRMNARPLPEERPLDIYFEDDDIIVLNKPAGLVVHPGAGHSSGTLVNALRAHAGAALSGIGGIERPGIVHRLDKDTSGLMVVAKNDVAHQGLVAQFQDKTLKRTYSAIILGALNPLDGVIEGAIGRHPVHRKKMTVRPVGKEAMTHYKTEEIYADHNNIRPFASFVTCLLQTGRTHQIRVHMAHRGHPLIGDSLYGRQREKKLLNRLLLDNPLCTWGNNRQALHARALQLRHPITSQRLKFEAPPLKDMSDLRDILKKYNFLYNPSTYKKLLNAQMRISSE